MQGSREAGWAQSESNALTHLPLQDAFHRTVSPSVISARNICCDPPHPPRLRHATLYNHKPYFLPLHNGSLQIRVIGWNWGNIYSCDIYTYLTKANEAACTHIWEHICIFYNRSAVSIFFFFLICHIQEGIKEKNHIYTKAIGDHQLSHAAPAMRLKANIKQFLFFIFLNLKTWK